MIVNLTHSVKRPVPVKIETESQTFAYQYIYVIHQTGGPYWEKLCPRSWIPVLVHKTEAGE